MKHSSAFVKILFFFFFLTIISENSHAQVRAIWATAWSIKNAEQIDQLIATAKKYKFNQIFVQSRYRSDALYIPNRKDSTCQNPEKRSYILNVNPAFDPLQYLIDKTQNTDIEIHAWVTVFVMSNADITKLPFAHLWFQHPEWTTYYKGGKIMTPKMSEGAFMDPGIPQTHDYLLNILSDIVKNYNIKGIQLDYIRYPDSLSGYNPLALKNFNPLSDTTFHQWKVNQITNFVRKVYQTLKTINPDLKCSAAVIADRKKAYNQYSQDWNSWLEKGIIDKVYLMAYNTSSKTFKTMIQSLNSVSKKEDVVIGLRAWREKEIYPASKINEKIAFLRRHGFCDIAYYSYAGMVDANYFSSLHF